MSDELNSYSQKKKFHAMVRDIANQVEWAGEFLHEDEWKLLILAGAYGQDVVPNPLHDQEDPLSPPFLIRNKRRTRDLSKSGDKSMAELITQLEAFGSQKGVQWTDPKWLAQMAEAESRQ